MVLALLYMVIWLVAIALATLRGGSYERSGALIMLGVFALQLAVTPLLHPRFQSIYTAAALIDMLALAACIPLALRSPCRWTLWFAAAQLETVLGHGLRAITPAHWGINFTLLTDAPSYVQCLALICGTIAYQQMADRSPAASSL
jgi:hypothetical protein